MTREFELKQARLRRLLEQRGLDAVLLRRVSSFAWATCGVAPELNTATTWASSALLITRNARTLFTTNLEAARLAEAMGDARQAWEWRTREWHEPPTELSKIARGLQLGADGDWPGSTDISADMALLRSQFTPEESGRFCEVARSCAEALRDTAYSLTPGQSEYDMTARLSYEAERRGLQVTLRVVAADENILRYRHPLPGDRALRRYAMLVLNARRWGLVGGATRFVHFGPLPETLRADQVAAARVAAVLIAATTTGRPVGAILQEGLDAYAECGRPDEWRKHHLGGAAGYEAREMFATPSASEETRLGQVYTWNPSVGATRSVDSVLVSADGGRVITGSSSWPQLMVEVNNCEVARPAILEQL